MNYNDISDSMLRESAKRVRSAMLKSLPEPEMCHHKFSHKFEIKMKQLIKRNQKAVRSKYIIRSIAAMLTLVIFGTFIWFMSNSEAQADFLRWAIELFHDTAVYQFFGGKIDRDLPEYTFGWLPEGFSQEVAEADPDITIIIASDTDGNTFIFEYQFMDERSTRTELSRGNLLSRTVTVHKSPAHFYSDSAVGASSELIWMEDDIVFCLSSTMGEEVMLDVAEHITIKK